MSDVYYYGNTPMLKYQSGSTPCAIPIDKVAADLIESLQAEVKAANDRLSASRANVGLLQAKVEGWEKSYQDYLDDHDSHFIPPTSLSQEGE